MKKKAKIILIASIAAFAASVYSLAAAAAYQPDGVDSSPTTVYSTESNYNEAVSSEPFQTKIIKIYDGSIAVFEESSDTPIGLLGANIDDLPKDTVEQLNQGITATTQDEYLSYLEDFS